MNPSSRMLNKTATVKRPTAASQNGRGVWTQGALETIHSAWPCALQPISQGESERLYGQTVEAQWTLYGAATLDDGTAVVVKLQDTIEIDSTSYKVVALPSDEGGRGRVYAVGLGPLGGSR